MIVICPNCSTSFNFPDEYATENVKLRCSVCKHVFALPEHNDISLNLNLDMDSFSTPKKKDSGQRGKISLRGCLAILVFVASVGLGVMYMQPELMPTFMQELFTQKDEAEALTTEERIKSIVLRDVRHYDFNNEKIGAIAVIEGKVINAFDTPRELIRLEASLYNKEGVALVAKQQLAGTLVSLFQLQVLGESELEKALSNKIDILTNNTNVMPGGEVPFMIVFYNPSDTAVEFGVKVIDAALPPNKTP